MRIMSQPLLSKSNKLDISYQISAAAENTREKLHRVRCNSYSFCISKAAREMLRSSGVNRARSRSVRFSHLDDDEFMKTANAEDSEEAKAGEMLSMIKAKSEPAGIALK